MACNVLVENNSDRALEFTGIAYSSPGVRIANLPIAAPAHGRVGAKLVFEPNGALGAFAVGVGLTAKGYPDKALRVSAKGFSYSMLDEAGTSLAFGVVNSGSSEGKNLSLASDDNSSLHATQVISQPDFITSTLAADGRSVRVAIADDADWGLQTGKLLVGLSSPDEPKAQFPVSANVMGAIRPNHNPVSFGMAAAGKQHGVSVRLAAENHESFRVGEVKLKGLQGEVGASPCKPMAKGCQQLELRISPEQPPGYVNGEMVVSLPDYGKSLDIKVTGILVRASKSEPAASGNKSTEASEPVAAARKPAERDIRKTSRSKPRSMSLAPPDPPGSGPVLRWSVANEQPLYGYLIYRAEDKNGPWQRVNAKIIPVLGHDDSASLYAWRDTSAVKGKTYWYFIKTLANNGTKEKLTEAQKVVAH